VLIGCDEEDVGATSTSSILASSASSNEASGSGNATACDCFDDAVSSAVVVEGNSGSCSTGAALIACQDFFSALSL